MQDRGQAQEPLMSPETRLVWSSRARIHPRRRARQESRRAEFVASLTGGRGSAVVLDADTAELIRCFESPATVVDAVLRFCRERQAEPEVVLESSWPCLEGLVRRHLLVKAAGSEGLEIPGFSVERSVHRPPGGEVFSGRTSEGARAALKVQWQSRGLGELAVEAAALDRLAGRCAPRLLDRGTLPEGGQWILREWVDGAGAVVAGASARREDGGRIGALAFRLAADIARTYAAVHAADVLHGDIHADNVLVDRRGEVTLIDFALARGIRAPLVTPVPTTRAGVLFSVEPEQARAMLAGARHRPSSPAGEQFAVAVLLYEALTGSPYMDFRLDRTGLLRQIAAADPRPFAALGLESRPALEGVLRRALSPRPEHRFPDLDAFATALEALAEQQGTGVPISYQRPSVGLRGSKLREVARQVRRRLERAEIPREIGPDVYRGLGGVAYAQLQLASRRQDPALLSAAELSLAGAERRFAAARKGAESGDSSPRSPFLAKPGVFLVRALLDHALTDESARDRAIGSFLRAYAVPRSRALRGAGGEVATPTDPASLDPASSNPVSLDPASLDSWRDTELMAGDAGALLACAALLELGGRTPEALRRCGERLSARLTASWRARPPVGRAGECLGLAHGWGGELYAALRWADASGAAPSPELFPRLNQLAGLVVRRGRGGSWPRRRRTLTAGWCHGSAGYVYLWAAAARAAEAGHAGDGPSAESCRRLAELAAWAAWEGPAGNGSLCCGMAGRAWALLHQADLGGGSLWRDRARSLAERAATAAMPEPEWSLYKGALALALLEADLESEARAVFPFFGQEGWGLGS